MKHTRPARSLLALAVLLCASRAPAFNFFELEAYRAPTDGRGMMKLESFNTVVPRGSRSDDGEVFRTEDMVRSSLEVNYGVTDRLDLALYVDTAKPENRDLRYAGLRLRAHGFVAQDLVPVDLGWYAELEFPQRHFADEDAAVEVRGLLSREWHRFGLRFNPTLEQAFNGDEAGEGPELLYAAQASFALADPVTIALQAFGDLGALASMPAVARQEHYLVPVVQIEPFDGFELAAGPGFGLTSSSDDLFVKVAIEYKFSLGAP